MVARKVWELSSGRRVTLELDTLSDQLSLTEEQSVVSGPFDVFRRARGDAWDALVSLAYWWEAFDPGEVREELAHIADLGFHVVRFFMRLGELPASARDRGRSGLRNLAVVLDQAGDAGLRAMPTFFTGNMSGPAWHSDWATEPAAQGWTGPPVVTGKAYRAGPWGASPLPGSAQRAPRRRGWPGSSTW